MQQYYIYGIVAAVVIIIQFVGFRRYKKLKSRTALLRSEAMKLGLGYAYYNDNYERDSLLGFNYLDRTKGNLSSLMNSGVGIYHIVKGPYDSQDVLAFDYTFSAHRNSGVNHAQTVFIFTDETKRTGDFSLKPASLVKELVSSTPENASKEEQFNRQFELDGDGVNFSGAFIDACLTYPNMNMEKVGERIVFFEKDYCIEPKNLKANLEFYTGLMKALN